MHLEPVRNVRVKLFRMLYSIIEDFNRLRRLEAGLEEFALTMDVDKSHRKMPQTSIKG